MGKQKGPARKGEGGKEELGVMSRKLAFYPKTETSRQRSNLSDMHVRKTLLADMGRDGSEGDGPGKVLFK